MLSSSELVEAGFDVVMRRLIESVSPCCDAVTVPCQKVRVEATTTYVEMTDPAALRVTRQPAGAALDLRRAEIASPELNRFLYTAVGGEWNWRDKLSWNHQRWQEFISRPGFQTWVLNESGTPAGYFELNKDDSGDVEIVSFGLLPRFIGRRIGGYLLTAAVECAWAMDTRRVWLHTWSLDHPSALPNYLARGFTVFREERFTIEAPAEPPGPWPGAWGAPSGSGFDWLVED